MRLTTLSDEEQKNLIGIWLDERAATILMLGAKRVVHDNKLSDTSINIARQISSRLMKALVARRSIEPKAEFLRMLVKQMMGGKR